MRTSGGCSRRRRSCSRGSREDALVLVSSQLPVGSVAELAARCAARRGQDDLRFACVPENLRLGQALESFRAPDRVVVGVRCERDRLAVAELLAPLNFRIEWMGVESAEMTKHALNGFLATSVAFINEVAAVCESVGADAAEVSRGLKSESRIGPRAYLAPGDSFAGGTLARDIVFLRELAARHALPSDVFTGVERGNSRAQELGAAQAPEPAREPGGGHRSAGGRSHRDVGADIQARHEHAASLQRRRAVPLADRRRRERSSPRPRRRSACPPSYRGR